MAINFPSGFQITGNEPIDSRFVLTKAEMLAMKKARLPQVYFAVCPDDGLFYVYNANNTVDPETGRFRPVAASGDFQITQEFLEALVSQDEDNIIQVMTDGLKVTNTEPESITDEFIKNLFGEEVEVDGQSLLGPRWSEIV